MENQLRWNTRVGYEAERKEDPESPDYNRETTNFDTRKGIRNRKEEEEFFKTVLISITKNNI